MKRKLLSLLFIAAAITARDFLPKWNEGIQAVSYGRSTPSKLPPVIWSTQDFDIRMPAEFEPSRGLIVSWSTYDWYTENIYFSMLGGLSGNNKMFIVVLNEAEEIEITRRILAEGLDITRTDFMQIETNSCWIRDYSPIFVATPDDSLRAIDMNYYADRDLDDDFPSRFAETESMERYELDLFIEGGNIMTDGNGLLVVGDILYENNPLNTVLEIDSMLCYYFGCDRVVALESMTADGTGHVDMFAKFIDAHTVLLASTDDTTHPDFAVLEHNVSIMETLSLSDSSGSFNVIRISIEIEYRLWPPGWVYNTYTNSLILDSQVFVPVFNNPLDSNAIQVYSDAMPGYEIIPINSAAIIHSGGAIHCLAMQYPENPVSDESFDDRQLPYVNLINRIYPNPFNSVVTIETNCVPQKALATIYDVMGHRIRFYPGLPSSRFGWDATDDYGLLVSSGVYFIIIRQDSLEDRQKIIYAR